MKNIFVFAILLGSIILTIILVNKNIAKKQAASESIEQSDSTQNNEDLTPTSRELSAQEIQAIKQSDAYADSVSWQLIPTNSMEVSPGFWDGGSYFSAEFRGAYPSGMPIYAVKTYKSEGEEDLSSLILTMKNGIVLRTQRAYFLEETDFGVGQEFNYYDESGTLVGTKNRKLIFNTSTSKTDTLDQYFLTTYNSKSPSKNPNDLLQQLIDASLGRGDFALTFEGIIIDSANTYIQTQTFNDQWTAKFIVNEQDRTYQMLSKDPSQYVGKVIKIDQGFGMDPEKGGRKNFYNGSSIVN